MALGSVVLELVLIVATMLVTATLAIVGPRPISRALTDWFWRIGAIALPTTVLASVLALRWGTRDLSRLLSRQVIGMPITASIYELEEAVFPRNPVAVLQSVQSPELTSVFAFTYIYGYAFLLAFPAIAYFALEDDRMERLSTLLLAYSANYGIGLLCYVVFIAYGPRNFDPTLFESLLYVDYPASGYLTHTVNQNDNVFPSLHASMAITVFLLAWHTREEYPMWVPISGALAFGVALSTMYLGIHWFSDVVAGTLLALLSVYIARKYTVNELLRRGSETTGFAVDRTGAFVAEKVTAVRTFLIGKVTGGRAEDEPGESSRSD